MPVEWWDRPPVEMVSKENGKRGCGRGECGYSSQRTVAGWQVRGNLSPVTTRD